MTQSIQKFHKMAVTVPAPGYISLATENEILLSEAQNVLTFQGHPELVGDMAKEILDADTGDFTSGFSKEELDNVFKSVKKPHDGDALFARIAAWARS